MAIILPTFSNWFPFIKLLYFLSQFSLKHGGYFVSDNHWTQVIYCGPHKMTAILQTNLKCIFLHGNCCIFLEISFKFENILDNFVNDVFKYLSWMETFAVFIHINFSNCWLKSVSIYAADLGSSRRQAIICRVPNWYWQHKQQGDVTYELRIAHQ